MAKTPPTQDELDRKAAEQAKYDAEAAAHLAEHEAMQEAALAEADRLAAEKTGAGQR